MKLVRRLCLVAASLVLLLVVAGCGGDDSKSTSSTTASQTQTKTTAPKPDDGKQPNGTLTTSAIGDIKVGSTQQEVLTAFGKPDKKDSSDPAAPVWQWSLKDGVVKIRFQDDKVRSYFTDSTLLKTKSGFHVGDPIDEITAKVTLQQNSSLKGQVGEEIYTLSEGSAGTFPALVFEVTKGVVVAISGGDQWDGSSDQTATDTTATATSTVEQTTPTQTAPVTTSQPAQTTPATTPTGDNGGAEFGQ